jgi:phosphate uptake regulator
MKRSSNHTKSWKSLQKNLERSSSKGLIKLVRALYDLNDQNRRFLCARLVSGDSNLQDYKAIIRRALYPDVCSKDDRLDLRAGRKAISDFKKASNDPGGVLELMVYYVEEGNKFTVDYGDIDEQFYSSLESMFDAVLRILKKSPDTMVARFLPRLRAVVAKADGIGWGYYDCIAASLEAVFPGCEEGADDQES